MEPVRMSHRSNQPALPNIHTGINGTNGTKPPEFSDTTPQLSQSLRSSRSNYASAKSVDSMSKYNTAAMTTSNLESLFPEEGDEDTIDMGRIRIERKSHKALLPPSVSYLKKV